MTKQEQVIRDMVLRLEADLEIHGRLKIVTYQDVKPIVAIFAKGSSKPFAHYKFKTLESRAAFIQKQKDADAENERSEQVYLSKQAEEAKKLQPGVILYSSWGWEQTNIDWYEVIERRGQMLTVQQIGTRRMADDEYYDRGKCLPDPAVKIGQPFRKRVTKHGTINLESYKWCGLWDGEPKYWSSYA